MSDSSSAKFPIRDSGTTFCVEIGSRAMGHTGKVEFFVMVIFAVLCLYVTLLLLSSFF